MKKKNKNKFILKSVLLFCLLIFSLGIVSAAFAQSLVPCGIGAGNANCTLCHLVIGFKNIYDYLLFTILFPATVVVIVIAGIMYMVSAGSKTLVETAKKAFTYALAAIVIALTAWLLINVILNALGYKNAGSWYNFTCDTVQTTGPGTTGPNGQTLPGSSSTGSGSGASKIVGTGVVSSGQMTADEFFKEMEDNSIYVNREAGAQTGWIDGKYYNDCSGSVQEWAIKGFGYDPGGSTREMMQGAAAYQGVDSLKIGDTLIVNGSSGSTGHAVMYIGDGYVMGNSGEGKNVRVSPINSYTVAGVKSAL